MGQKYLALLKLVSLDELKPINDGAHEGGTMQNSVEKKLKLGI